MRPPSAVVAAIGSAALVLVATARTPQQLYSDPGWQLKAAQQYVEGRSPTPNTLVAPDERDLSRDQAGWLFWWAPGTNYLTTPLIAAGFSLATAVRFVAALLFLLGAVGWALWTRLMQLSRGPELALSAAIPWIHYANNGLFQYSAETLVFGIMPWTLVAACRVVTTRTAIAAATVGGLCGIAYVLKYSTALAVVGLVGWLMSSLWIHRKAGRPSALNAALIVAVAMAIPVVWLSFVNRQMSGSANLLTAPGAAAPERFFAPLALGAPALIAADLDSLLHYVLTNPARPVIFNEAWLLLVGLPATGLVAWACLKEGNWDRPKQLAAAVFGSSVIGLAAIWATSAAVSHETRHVATAGLAILPLSLRAGCAAWRAARPLTRAALLGAFGIYLLGPALYGAAAVAAKIIRTPHGYRPGPSGFYNPLFASADASSCRAELIAEFDARKDVWYLPEPMSALDLPGRAVMVDADFLEPGQLALHQYRTSTSLRVFALLPHQFDVNGKGAIIRSSFVGAGDWTRAALANCSYVLWRSTLSAMAPMRP